MNRTITRRVTAAGLVAALTAMPAEAETVLIDHFDDLELDPSWVVTLQDADGWSYSESGTALTVTDVDPSIINPGGGGTWAHAFLIREHAAVDDFHIEFDLAWDSFESNAAQQQLFLELLDVEGSPVIGAGYGDSWIGGRGCRYARIGDTSQCAWNELPHAGSASIAIDRTGEDVAIDWNGADTLAGTSAETIAGVRLRFSYYAQPGSIFGMESVDRVSVEGEPTPIERTTWTRIKSRF